MNIIDAVILLIILMFGTVGLKRGFFKQTVMTLGTLLVFYLAYKFKDPLALLMSSVFPFFKFTGNFQGVSVLNVVLYQLLAFLIMLILFLIVLNILIKISGIIEKILKFTIVLGIPSKILGFIVGIIEGYVIVFVALFFLNQPAVNLEIINESKLMDKILDSTPLLSNVITDTNTAIKDIYSLSEKFIDNENSNQLNLLTTDILLKYNVVDKEYIEKLVDNGKLSNVVGIEEILNKYK